VILADLIGSRLIFFIKNENGLYTEDPKKNPQPNSFRASGSGNCSIATKTI